MLVSFSWVVRRSYIWCDHHLHRQPTSWASPSTVNRNPASLFRPAEGQCMPSVDAAFANRRPSNQRHLEPVERPNGCFIGPSLITMTDEANRPGRPILAGMIGQNKPYRQWNIHEIGLPGRFQAPATRDGTGTSDCGEHECAGNKPQPEFSVLTIAQTTSRRRRPSMPPAHRRTKNSQYGTPHMSPRQCLIVPREHRLSVSAMELRRMRTNRHLVLGRR